jgi:hypothetical protein
MNERIRQLFEQAVLQANEVFDQKGKDYPGIVMEKFAELIISECIRIDVENRDAAPGVEIAKHFGVEE